MNRFDKEQLRKYLYANMENLSAAQRRDFVYKFGRNRGSRSKTVITQIDNKLLRRAHRHVYNIVNTP